MDTNSQAIVFVVVGLASLVGLSNAVHTWWKNKSYSKETVTDIILKELKDEQKRSREATDRNTEQLIEMNANFRHMTERDNARDTRMNRHSEKIDNNTKDIIEMKKDVTYIKDYVEKKKD